MTQLESTAGVLPEAPSSGTRSNDNALTESLANADSSSDNLAPEATLPQLTLPSEAELKLFQPVGEVRRKQVRPLEQPPVSLALERFRNGQALIEPLGNRSRWYMALKRLSDIAGASLLVLLFSPILLGTLVLLAITTKGHPLFFQERVGYLGRRFKMIKFRTMRLDADKMQQQVVNEKDGPIFKNRQDPRITRIGRFLRKSSIDEMPQLFNVLSGSMSLVGPRPPVPKEVEKYEPWQRRRLAIKPGLTCLWQTSGRSEIGFEDWVRMDLWYLRNQDLWTDAKLLAATPKSVVTGKGAY